MLYFGWQQTKLLPSLIWPSYLFTIKIAYASWCTDAFSWAANSVCPALLLLAKQSLRLTLPLPMTLVKLRLPVQIPVALQNICQVQSSLMLSHQKHHARSISQISLRKHQTLESRTFNIRFPVSRSYSSKKEGQVYETRKKKREGLIFCLLLIKTDLIHESVFINREDWALSVDKISRQGFLMGMT